MVYCLIYRILSFNDIVYVIVIKETAPGYIAFASITFGDGFFQFQDNKVSVKQATGHNHENTIFHPGPCTVNDNVEQN